MHLQCDKLDSTWQNQGFYRTSFLRLIPVPDQLILHSATLHNNRSLLPQPVDAPVAAYNLILVRHLATCGCAHVARPIFCHLLTPCQIVCAVAFLCTTRGALSTTTGFGIATHPFEIELYRRWRPEVSNNSSHPDVKAGKSCLMSTPYELCMH